MSAPRQVVAVRLLVVSLLVAAYLPIGGPAPTSASGVDHLVISEVMTGGASASDELIELYNPTAGPLPLEGLELVYVTASGATVTRRAAWQLGAPEVGPGSHLLVANQLGVFAPIADALSSGGMAATGGSVALRIQGAATAIDAVGWGTAASTWLEGVPVAAPPAGSSLERLPGGAAGSTVDTDHNALDFVQRSMPDPQNSGSAPVPNPSPSGTPAPTPTEMPTPTDPPAATDTPAPTAVPTVTPDPTATTVPSATPAPEPISIAVARALADGTVATVEGDALTGSDFTDGGGYLADGSGGIAVMVEGGAFARGDRVRVTGSVDDRFSQRTIRAEAAGLVLIGSGPGPDPVASTTGALAEPLEGVLARIAGTIVGSPTTLTGGVAYDVDDGTGAARVIVGNATGIDSAGWASGARVGIVGVVGQRDSTGSGSSGYRVQPRGPNDVEMLALPTPTPSPTSSAMATPTPSPAATPSDQPVVAIAEARAAPKNARLAIRGVVTLASGTVDVGSAVLQDATGAILLRLGDEAGALARGELLEVAGVRSTKAGMASLRVVDPPLRLGTAADPSAQVLRTGDASESTEALLVVSRGAVVASARRASSGTVSFEIDDGSGPLRIVLDATLSVDADPYVAGSWVEVRGVLGQETSGAQPLRGYRIWPRGIDDLRILAAATGATPEQPASRGGTATAGAGVVGNVGPTGSLAAVGGSDLSGLRVGATLVASGWDELGVAGLLWDGERLVGIAAASQGRVRQILVGRSTPLALELGALREHAEERRTGIRLVVLGPAPGDTAVGTTAPVPPSPSMPAPGEPPSWVTLVGRIASESGGWTVKVAGVPVPIERLCRRGDPLGEGTASLLGVGLADPARIVVGCDGVRPAPILALRVMTLEARRPSVPATLAALQASADPTDDRRLLASVLLSAGVLMILAAAVIGRRFGASPPDAGARAVATDDESEPGSPRLTLVPLPREHGP